MGRLYYRFGPEPENQTQSILIYQVFSWGVANIARSFFYIFVESLIKHSIFYGMTDKSQYKYFWRSFHHMKDKTADKSDIGAN